MFEKNIRALYAVLIVLWPITTYASGESLGKTFGSLHWADWLAVFLLSGISGVVALLQRMRKSFEARALELAGKPFDATALLLIDLRFYAISHFSASLLMGFIAFLICEYQDVNSHLEAMLIAASAWGGAYVADRWADRAAETIANMIGPKERAP